MIREQETHTSTVSSIPPRALRCQLRSGLALGASPRGRRPPPEQRTGCLRSWASAARWAAVSESRDTRERASSARTLTTVRWLKPVAPASWVPGNTQSAARSGRRTARRTSERARRARVRLPKSGTAGVVHASSRPTGLERCSSLALVTCLTTVTGRGDYIGYGIVFGSAVEAVSLTTSLGAATVAASAGLDNRKDAPCLGLSRDRCCNTVPAGT